jgi:hypothetical protein
MAYRLTDLLTVEQDRALFAHLAAATKATPFSALSAQGVANTVFRTSHFTSTNSPQSYFARDWSHLFPHNVFI